MIRVLWPKIRRWWALAHYYVWKDIEVVAEVAREMSVPAALNPA
jgi:hypothetical protein